MGAPTFQARLGLSARQGCRKTCVLEIRIAKQYRVNCASRLANARTSAVGNPGPSTLPPQPTFGSPVAHPAFLVGGLTLYTLIAADVFSPDSWHILQHVDQGVHQTVLANVNPVIRKEVFGAFLSNVGITSASVGWILVTATALSRNNPLAWGTVALSWALWIFGVGPIEHDPALMEVLKTSFGRIRPSPIHRTASFPSGHTAADVFAVGALLFVLLPVVFGSATGKNNSGKSGAGGAGGGDTESVGAVGGGRDGSGRGILGAVYSVQNSWALWGLSAVTTIAGRVGVDAHWLSDTLAGGALSLALVSALAAATQRLAETRAGRAEAAVGIKESGLRLCEPAQEPPGLSDAPKL